jgi:hypothetical protein
MAALSRRVSQPGDDGGVVSILSETLFLKPHLFHECTPARVAVKFAE